MNIFVSHALTDQALIKSVKNTLEPLEITLFIAEHYEDLQRTITEKIEDMIKKSDVALILLTENGFNSNFVQQEIGYIKSLNKPCLQIVEVGIEKRITGFNFGKGYILYDPNQPQHALEKMSRSLLAYWNQKEQKRIDSQKADQRRMQQRQLQAIRIANERRANEAKIGIGILAGLLVLGLASSDLV